MTKRRDAVRLTKDEEHELRNGQYQSSGDHEAALDEIVQRLFATLDAVRIDARRSIQGERWIISDWIADLALAAAKQSTTSAVGSYAATVLADLASRIAKGEYPGASK